MSNGTRIFVLSCAVFLPPAIAGPVEFAMEEYRRALAARGLKPERYRLMTEIGPDAPESFRIVGNRVVGGDLRGLMYGLLEAAGQIRDSGRILPAKGVPATPMRGIRVLLQNESLEKEWYYSPEYWRAYFAMLARNRFNRFNLVFAHQTRYLAPPYPYWVEVEQNPEVRVPGLSAADRQRNLDMLRFISQCAADHGIDFTLGIWEHNVQHGMAPNAEGLTDANIGPYSYLALKKVLAYCPAIRSVQIRTNIESGIPNDRQVEFYRDWIYRAIREAGRLVHLDLRGWMMGKGMLEAAIASVPSLRLSAKYWAEHLGRPHQPLETWPGYSYLEFLHKPRPYQFYWELWGLGSHRLLLWGNPEYVRRAVPTFRLSGSMGFEIDPPLAQKGYGNAPGLWGVFTAAQQSRVFWKYEFERYWFFYWLWGRLSYDPRLPEKSWLPEFERRFGKAALDVLAAYRHASTVLNEIVTAHTADPNMYIWPEVNPGGLIDAYAQVRPSDFRLVATIPEAVGNQLEGKASAKQTPRQTAALLAEAAAATEAAVERAAKRLGARHPEWASSESDFRVLALLARYHAHKQIAAEQLTMFYETSQVAALDAAEAELRQALAVWEQLVAATDGVYPDRMAFGPADAGHWKDRLPYVRHDLKLAGERRLVLQRYGRFDYGFDFGGPLIQRRGGAYRNDPWVLEHSVEPRFRHVDPSTLFDEERGYGWASSGDREAVPLPETPLAEIRAPRPIPGNCPRTPCWAIPSAGAARRLSACGLPMATGALL